jgi:hypothetical protein
MRTAGLGRARPARRETETLIVFWVGPYRMAISAGALKEIRNEDDLPTEGREETRILSAHSLFGVPPGRGSRVLVLRSGPTFVRVDRVERMIETGPFFPLPKAFQGPERQWYCGLALDSEFIVPVADPATLTREAQSGVLRPERCDAQNFTQEQSAL